MWAGRDLFDEKQDWIHLLEHLFNDRDVQSLRKCTSLCTRDFVNRDDDAHICIAGEEIVGRIRLDDRKKAGMYHALSITMLNPFVMETIVEFFSIVTVYAAD